MSGGARKVADTSMEEGPEVAAKSQKLETEAPWEELIREMKETRAEVRTAMLKFEQLTEKVEEQEIQIAEGKTRQEALELEVEELKMENMELRGKYSELRADLDDQIDRGMRENVNFYGIKQPAWERKPEDTIKVLCDWLAGKMGKEASYFDAAITRGHRGPKNPEKNGPRPIFCKMRYRVAEEVRDKLRYKDNGGVWVKDQFCQNTQGRLNKALMYRKEWKSKNPLGKSYVSFPATVHVRTVTDTEYKLEKEF